MAQKVFIIHGWTYKLDKWDQFCELLSGKGYEPVMLKVPGLTTPSHEVWDIDGYVTWLDRQLIAEEQPIVIGHSNGGRIALSYILQHPNRFKHLILVDSAGVPKDDFKSNVKRSLLKLISVVGKPFAKIPKLRNLFYRFIGARDYYEASPNMRLTMQNMFIADKGIDLQKIQVPVTLIWGAHDTYTPLSDGEKMAQEIPAAQLHIIENAKHAPFWTHPQQVCDLVVQAVENNP